MTIRFRRALPRFRDVVQTVVGCANRGSLARKASHHSRRRAGAMTRRETRRETREADREAREVASALDPAPATPAAPAPRAGQSTKPKPLDATERFEGPGVPYEHRFSPVSRGPVGVATLDGTVAADLVCWEYFYGKPCASEAERASERTSSEDATRLEPWKSWKSRAAGVDGANANDARPRRIIATTVPSSSCNLCHAIGTADDVCRGRVREALGQVRPKKGVRARLGSDGRRPDGNVAGFANDADADADADAARKRFVVCRYGPRCDRAHPSDAEVRGNIEDWYVTRSLFSRGGAEKKTDEKDTADRASGSITKPNTVATDATPARIHKPTWSVLGSGASDFRARHAAPRAARTSADEQPRTTPRESASARVRRRLAKKAETSRYVSEFVREHFFDAILDGDPAFVRVLSHKSAHKEITEAYGARREIERTLAGLGRDGNKAVANGKGVTVFDACSGRGVVGVLLSYFFPDARVVMLDANGSMDLSHVAGRENVRFWHCDLFGDSAVRAIRETIETENREDADFSLKKNAIPPTPPRRRFRVLLGMHLCGALSPRLIDLAFGLDDVDGLVLCPCCVKGGLGGACRRAAKARKVSPYVVLCETLRRVCEEETERRAILRNGDGSRFGNDDSGNRPRSSAEEEDARAFVVARADENVLSPVNGFICVAKSGPGMRRTV